MALLDRIKDGISAVVPASENRRSKVPPPTMGIANAGAGHAPFEDDMIVSKPLIVFHTSQIFFNFLAMCCFASVAAFQAKWKIGPSGLTGLAIFLSIMGIFLPLFMLLVPVAYERYDKVIRLARALREVRVGFILTGTGTSFSLLIAFATTISAFTEPGCKNPDDDPHAKLGDSFKSGLSGWCSTKKAGAIFFWGAFIFWLASLTLLVLEWRSGKLHSGPRDPPFQHPTQEATDYEMDYDPDDEEYQHIPPVRRGGDEPASYDPPPSAANPFSDQNRYAAGRPSVDAYGAFSDPAPSGFSPAAPRFASPGPPVLPPQDLGPPMGVSRTMQYADPYAAVRATIAGGGPPEQPQGYEGATGYQGYR
ncbi:WD-REPEATS-REGION domain-containing protein [Mycena chlorophos]|uniref:WD-REPEATS-REGION domain-containing protein n=1 Tax=Mycena chlorophos TaxID=658473 RepID=A0A8H6WHH4_MYCCL|nr:WD-REPEATS-REGION domain-containing protein [Mycena chlorophos]